MSDVIKFIDPYPTPEEVAETMKDRKAGIIGLCQSVAIDSSCGVNSHTAAYSGDAGDETEEPK